MPTIGWIDALRRWNAGSPSWCIPRKGTVGYESVMRIRRGEPEKSVRERVEELEARTPKEKKERKTIRVKLTKEVAEPPVENNVDKTQQKMNGISKTKVASPKEQEEMATGKNQASPMGGAGGPVRGGGGSSSSVLDRINAQIQRELETGVVSVEYDLGWRPETEEEDITSGARRIGQIGDYKYVLGLPWDENITQMSIPELEAFIRENEKTKDNVLLRRVQTAKELIERIKKWKPENEYRGGYGRNYNTKTKTTKYREIKDKRILPALEDYQKFADELNKIRRNPIRNISYSYVFEPNGDVKLEVYWTIDRSREEEKDGLKYYYDTSDYYFIRRYSLEPFRFLKGATFEGIREQEEREKQEAEAKAEAKAKAKEDDPILKLKKQVEELNLQRRQYFAKSGETREQAQQRLAKADELEAQIEAVKKQIKKLEKERKEKAKTEREATAEGQAYKELDEKFKEAEKKYYKSNKDEDYKEYMKLYNEREAMKKQLKKKK